MNFSIFKILMSAFLKNPLGPSCEVTRVVVEAARDGEEIVKAWEKNCTREWGDAASLPLAFSQCRNERVHSILLQSLISFIQVLLLLRAAAGNVLCYFFLLMRILFCKSCCALESTVLFGCCLDFSHAFHEIHMCGVEPLVLITLIHHHQ